MPEPFVRLPSTPAPLANGQPIDGGSAEHSHHPSSTPQSLDLAHEPVVNPGSSALTANHPPQARNLKALVALERGRSGDCHHTAPRPQWNRPDVPDDRRDAGWPTRGQHTTPHHTQTGNILTMLLLRHQERHSTGVVPHKAPRALKGIANGRLTRRCLQAPQTLASQLSALAHWLTLAPLLPNRLAALLSRIDTTPLVRTVVFGRRPWGSGTAGAGVSSAQSFWAQQSLA